MLPDSQSEGLRFASLVLGGAIFCGVLAEFSDGRRRSRRAPWCRPTLAALFAFGAFLGAHNIPGIFPKEKDSWNVRRLIYIQGMLECDSLVYEGLDCTSSLPSWTALDDGENDFEVVSDLEAD